VNTLFLEAWLMNDQTVTLLLRLIHILAGIFWVGVAFLMAGFLIPTVRETGQAGGRFMEHLMLRRRLPVFVGIAMLLTVLSGFAMYGRLVAATNGAWAGTRPGMAYGLGGLAAVLGAVVGMGIGGAAGRRMAGVSRRIAEAGGPPSAEQQSEIERLRGRMSLGARLAAGLLFISAATMAIARYL
jgi:uncharacterized membrane protein